MMSIYLAYFKIQLRVFSAVSCQLNELDFRIPSTINSSRSGLFVKTVLIASDSSLRLCGSTSIAELPTVSGIEELRELLPEYHISLLQAEESQSPQKKMGKQRRWLGYSNKTF